MTMSLLTWIATIALAAQIPRRLAIAAAAE
jgi:hypothetical protein